MAEASDLQDTYLTIGRPKSAASPGLRWTRALRVNRLRTQVSAAPRTQDNELFLGDYQGTAASDHAIHVARPEAQFGPGKSPTSALYVATIRY